MPDDHLYHLLLSENEQPIYKSLFQSFKELVHPPQLPPLELTSQPVAVKDIWGLYGRQKKSFLLSTGFQAAAVVLLFTALSSKTVQKQIQRAIPLIMPSEADIPKPVVHQGGGGGAAGSPLPPNKGKLPKPALRQFVPPSAVINNPQAKLVMEASILAPPDAVMPSINLPNYGDPLGKLGPASNGTGSGGGIGSGKGGGGGSGNGGGVGPCSGGGFGDGVYRAGNGVSQPKLISKVEPEYSEEARKSKTQGVVVLQIVVDAKGNAIQPKIIRS